MHRPLAGRLILIVEDEPLIAFQVASGLQEAGGKVTSTSTLQHAMLIARHDDLSAAVIDHVLRDGDSAVLCRLLAERDIPFVMHSGLAAIDAPACRSAPHIPKPADPAEIVAALVTMLGARKISN
jgi:DNA-binding response OmpR family regulator